MKPESGVTAKSWPLWKKIIAFVVCVLCYAAIRVGMDNTPKAIATTASTDKVELKNGAQWRYSQDADPMSNGSTYSAMVVSTNTVNFKFPYAGAQHGKLTLRTDPRYGKNVILNIEKGQFLCRSYGDGCKVLVRFDDKEATNYSAMGPSDNSTQTIFIGDYSRFAGEMLKAKKVRISAEFFQEGSPVFEFDVSGFDVGKYRPEN